MTQVLKFEMENAIQQSSHCSLENVYVYIRFDLHLKTVSLAMKAMNLKDVSEKS